MKTIPLKSIKVIKVIFMAQLFMSCYSFKPLVKHQSSKSMNEVVQKIVLSKVHKIKLKVGGIYKIKITKYDSAMIYGTIIGYSFNGKMSSYKYCKKGMENSICPIVTIADIKVKKFSTVKSITISWAILFTIFVVPTINNPGTLW